jgi:two-component system NtrC family sensor kinase
VLDSSEVRDLDEKALYYLEILSHYAAVAIDFARMRKELHRTIELAQPLAMMGTMLRGFLHEIRNRINDLFAILSNITDTSASLYMTEKTGEMRYELMRLHQVCNDLAHFTRTDPVSVSEEVSLNDLVERTLGSFGTRMRDQGVVPENNVETPSPVVAGNPIQLEIAFKMLIQNALEAMDQGGCLVVDSSRDSAFTRISIRDTGPGMDEATKAQCFEPFFTTKRDSGGTGLGLSVVFGIMTRHDGRVEIQSAPGSGSTFTLLFPIK